MGCCGQKRAALSSTPSPTITPAVTQPAPSSRQFPSTGQQTYEWTGLAYSSVTLRYLESSPILVRGPATGRQYEFSGSQPVQSVDARDVEALLQTRFFRRAY